MNINKRIPPLVFFIIIILCLAIAAGIILYFKHFYKVFSQNYLTCKRLIENGEYQHAKKYCKAAVKMKPDYAAARIDLGLVYYHEGKLKEAEDQFLSSLKGSSIDYIYNKAIAYLNLGAINVKKGDVSSAWKYYNKAYKLAPSIFKENKTDYLLKTIEKKDKDSFSRMVISSRMVSLADFTVKKGAVRINDGSVLEDESTGFYMELYPYLRTDYSCRKLSRPACIYVLWEDKDMTISVVATYPEALGMLIRRFYTADEDYLKRFGRLIKKETIVSRGFKIYSKITEKNDYRIYSNILVINNNNNIYFIIFFTYDIKDAEKVEGDIKTMLESINFKKINNQRRSG